MKKALTILVAMLFLVVAVGVAYSAETTFNGQYKVRGWSNWNFDKKVTAPTSERGRYDGYFDQRFRLTITHTRSEFLKAVVQLDLVEDTWGQQRNFRINNSTVGEHGPQGVHRVHASQGWDVYRWQAACPLRVRPCLRRQRRHPRRPQVLQQVGRGGRIGDVFQV